MQITPEGWEYTAECHIVKDDLGTLKVHKEDVKDKEHYVLIDRYVGDRCLYFIYRPRAIQLFEEKQSIWTVLMNKICGI